jgi:hypothetical protein
MSTSQQYAILPITAPAWTGPNPCEGCGGMGVTGERYEMPTDTGPILLVDVICPDCGGCGNGDPEHRYCKPSTHAYPEDDYDAEDDEDNEDGQDSEPSCPSCNGRQWNAVTGFTADVAPDDAELAVLRVPCGCATPLLATGTDPTTLAPYPHVVNLPADIWPVPRPPR